MKIAYLINQYPQSSTSFIRREIVALESLGIEVHRFSVRRWDTALVDEGDRAEQARTRVVLDGGAMGLLTATLKTLLTRPLKFLGALRTALRVGRHSDRGAFYHLIYLAEACVLFKWFADCGAEHVHAHFGTNSTTVAMFCRLLGGPPYSFTAHGPEEFDRPQAIALGEKIERAAFAVAVSDFGRSQMYRWCGHQHWSKIHVVHCGLDRSFLDFAPDEVLAETVPSCSQLVCVGRLAEQKGQLLLMEAASRLLMQGMKFELILAGDGVMRGEIEEMIHQRNMGNSVRIAGWLSNVQVRQMILASRALVLPSFAEGLPVVLMEAMALKRPVISTYVAGIPELVEDGVCGFLVAAGNVDALTAAMHRVLTSDTQSLSQMGCEGARRIAERHNAATEAAKLSSLFRVSLASAKPGNAENLPPFPAPTWERGSPTVPTPSSADRSSTQRL